MPQQPIGHHRRYRLQRLLPVLVHIQTRLDKDLSLATLAEAADLSPSHFHHLFSEVIGETPKRYCQRLRLEHAAIRLVLFRTSILDTALACGFARHETFTRAFRKRFGITPQAFRAGLRDRSTAAPTTESARPLEAESTISATRIEELARQQIAFIRHVGPYQEVDPTTWQRLRNWALESGLDNPPFLLGIAHDAPSITPEDKLRFDAAIPVPGPVEPSREIGFQILPGGLYGVTNYVGPYSGLGPVYQLAFERLSRLRRYRVLALPAVEIYRTTPVSHDYELSQTDICLPLLER